VPLGAVAAHVDVGEVDRVFAAQADLCVERASAAKPNDPVPELDVIRKQSMDLLLWSARIEQLAEMVDRRKSFSRIKTLLVTVGPTRGPNDAGQ